MCILIVVMSLWAACASSEEGHVQEATIAVLCNHGYKQSMAQWSPTAAYLTEQIPGWSFTVSPLVPPEFESAIGRGAADFAIACPSEYVKVELLYGTSRIATMKTHYAYGTSHVFGAVFLSRSGEDAITQYAQIRGKRIKAMHGQDCTTWHIARFELLKYGLDVMKDCPEVSFSMRPSEVVQAILDDEADVGVLRSNHYDAMKARGQMPLDKICVVHEDDKSHQDVPFEHSTAVFPERVFAKLQQTSDELTEQVTVALLKMPSQGLAAEAAQCSGWTVAHNYQRIHDLLKTLRISPYEEYGKATLATIFSQYRPWLISIACLVVAIIAALGFALVQVQRLHRAQRLILEQQIVETSDRTQKALGESLHDTLGQQLTAIGMLTETLRERSEKQGGLFREIIGQIQALTREANCQSKQITVGLYPVILSQQGLAAAVESYLLAMKATFKIKYEIWFPEGIVFENPETSLHLYRIIQEAVHNATKHGHIKSVRVVLEEGMSCFFNLYIEDDGVGFDPESTDHVGLGLHIMRYRANTIGGCLTISRGKNQGTRVTCRFNPNHTARDDDRAKPVFARE